MKDGMTADQIRHLPAVIDLVTAGAALGLGRTKSYQLARTGDFPCRIIRAGKSYRVPTAELWTLLGLTDATAGTDSATATDPNGGGREQE